MKRLIIWECPVCEYHKRFHNPPRPTEHCDDCGFDVAPRIVYDSDNKNLSGQRA